MSRQSKKSNKKIRHYPSWLRFHTTSYPFTLRVFANWLRCFSRIPSTKMTGMPTSSLWPKWVRTCRFFANKKVFSKDDSEQHVGLKPFEGLEKQIWFVWFTDPLSHLSSLKLAICQEQQIVGDDLLVTNPNRIKKALEVGACNALLLKVNQHLGKIWACYLFLGVVCGLW